MRLYEPYNAIQPTGSVRGYSSLGSPAGVTLPAALEDLLQDLVGTMGWSDAGIVTPWAARTGDVAWTDIVNPDTNISLFSLNAAQLKKAEDVLFGTPLPFVIVLTNTIQPTTKLLEILEDAPYELYQTQAVYSQTDPKAIPSPSYAHWLKVKDTPDQPREPKSMDQVAQEMGGSLRYGQQVPVESTTMRPAPTLPYSEALVYNSNPPVTTTTSTPSDDEDDEEPSAPTQTTQATTAAQASARMPWLAMAAVGVGAFFATVAVGKALKK